MLFFNRNQRSLLISFAVLYSFLLIFCHFNSARDPGSFFFQPDEGYRPQHSLRRIEESLQYISRFNQSTTGITHSPNKLNATGQNTNVCVGIVTVNRPIQQNLDTTVGSILQGLSPEQRSKVFIHVLFALNNPSDHPDYQNPWVSNALDSVLTYDQLDAPRIKLEYYERKKRVRDKSIIDYRLSLQACYDHTDAPWFLMLEDDVVAQKEWYPHTMQSLGKIDGMERTGAVKNWLYLRLFYTEKFLGWNSENWLVYLASSLAIVSLVALAGIYGRRKMRSTQAILTNPFLAVICLLLVPLLIGLYFLAGRATMLPLKPGISIMNTNGCCSQALLFPRQKAKLLIDHLEKMQYVKSEDVDSAIEILADEKDLDRLVISPAQMQHVGAASYKENKKSYKLEGPYSVQGAHEVWSTEFETAYEDKSSNDFLSSTLWGQQTEENIPSMEVGWESKDRPGPEISD